MKDITVLHLDKSFGEKVVLRDFNAVFEAGKVTNIMGGSGCGKTTLLNILMGLEKADGGTVAGMPERIATVFQEYRLCEDFSAVSNVRLAAGKRVKTPEIERHLSMLGLGDSLYKPVRELSGGMKQRVAIVRAVLYDGDVLFLDEAFKGLDQETLNATIDYILVHTQGKTVIHVTHEKKEAVRMGGKVMEMEKIRDENRDERGDSGYPQDAGTGI